MYKFIFFLLLTGYFIHAVDANTQVVTLSPIVIQEKKKQQSLSVKKLKTENKFSPICSVLKNNNAVVLSSQGSGYDTISLRGVMQENLQIWVDGMPFQNGSSPTFNLSQMQIHDNQNLSIESGPLSAKRGMNSFLGTIDLHTKETTEKNAASTFFEIARYNTLKYGSAVSGKLNNTSGSLQASRSTTNGKVGFANRMSENTPLLRQSDFMNQNTLATRIDHQNDDWQISIFGRSGNSNMSYKVLPGYGPLDFRAKESYRLFRTVLKKKTGFWQPSLGAGQANFKRKDYIQQNNTEDTKSLSTVKYFNFDNILAVSTHYQIHANASVLQENYKNFTTNYGNTAYKKNRTFFNIGNIIHLDDTLIEIWTAIDGLRGKKRNIDVQMFIQQKICSCLTGFISGGTASRNPSLYQLFDTFSGNKNLLQEKALGSDIGLQYKANNHKIHHSYFYYSIKDKITGFLNNQGRYSYINQDFVKMYGLDSTYLYQYKQWKFGLEHLYTRTRDHNKKRLIKVPMHKMMASVEYDFQNDLGHIKLSFHHMGGFVDKENPTTAQTKQPNITTVDIESTYNLNKNISLYSAIENIFNERYEFPVTYQAGGLNMKFGVRIKL
jgi:vitamin B12 transporter